MQKSVSSKMLILLLLIISASFLLTNCEKSEKTSKVEMNISSTTVNETIDQLVKEYGESAEARIGMGVQQVADRWQSSDGDADAFKEFCVKNFVNDAEQRIILFNRFQNNLESLYGNLHKISRQFDWAMQVAEGTVQPADYLFANYSSYAHLSDDFFKTKIAFAALLNFPLKSLDEKNADGMNWSREEWAEIRLAEDFQTRVPSDVSQQLSEAFTAADDYINNYNIWMHYLVDDAGNRLFPDKEMKLISHWNLRDELKSQYANADGLPRQKMIFQVMKRIINQEIPEVVVDSDQQDWNPFTNTVYKQGTTEAVDAISEPNTRYKHIRNIFQGQLAVDPYYPQAPSLVDRRFKMNREMLESDVEQILISVLEAPVLKDIAAKIKQRVGRELEPFDIWYRGFKGTSGINETELDKIVGKRYKSTQMFQDDLPYILRNLGFTPSKAKFLSEHIQVDPSRGAGHASGAAMKEDKAHLRTRIPKTGMNYKGFNIAIHELGHNVEQVFSLNGMDHYSLNGVPNTAFTEAFAFVFQSRDLEVLGIRHSDKNAADLKAINDLWATAEISGVALVDMYIWRWMYAHPNATDIEIRNAMVTIAKDVWNKYFAPVLGMPDQEILAIYSHIVDGAMYTPDYPLGHIISFQIEEYLKEHHLATEMERMCKLGRLSPQIWMQQAVGSKVSAQPMIDAATAAIKRIAS